MGFAMTCLGLLISQSRITRITDLTPVERRILITTMRLLWSWMWTWRVLTDIHVTDRGRGVRKTKIQTGLERSLGLVMRGRIGEILFSLLPLYLLGFYRIHLSSVWVSGGGPFFRLPLASLFKWGEWPQVELMPFLVPYTSSTYMLDLSARDHDLLPTDSNYHKLQFIQ